MLRLTTEHSRCRQGWRDREGGPRATRILFVIADDPVRLGFVESFKRPGGNMTGLSMISGTLGAKRMELLRELVPKATAIAMLINPNNPAEDNVRDEQAAARAIGQRILVAEASTVREIEIAFAGIARQGADAVLVNADSFFTSQRDQLVALAARHHLPTVYAGVNSPGRAA